MTLSSPVGVIFLMSRKKRPVHNGLAHRVRTAASASLEDGKRGRDPLVLAVSGGRDSMVLLDVFARNFPERVACVATFDHGSGAAATRAAALVERSARSLGLPFRGGHLENAAIPRREAAWRDARWRFLRAVSSEVGAAVATAHTLDDQVETVFMRALRGSGARGLAGLFARSDVVRPLLSITRDEVAEYARELGIEWVEDPSNESRAHLRNRARRDLLPALERADPGFSSELVDLARRAALLREAVDAFVESSVNANVVDGTLQVARSGLLDYDAASLALLWPALAARVDAVLDRRGTERITEFTIRGGSGARIQLSGGWEAVLHRGMIVLRSVRSDDAPRGALPLASGVRFGEWSFRIAGDGSSGESGARAGIAEAVLTGAERVEGRDRWLAALPADAELLVRAWRSGDRMIPFGAAAPRRVKGLFRDAGIDAVRRQGWPVVVADGEIVWIPGVRHGAPSVKLSKRAKIVYECERHDERSTPGWASGEADRLRRGADRAARQGAGGRDNRRLSVR